MRSRICAITAAVQASLWAGPGLAQSDPGTAAIGREIAQTWCSNCHVIDRQATRAGDAMPSFPAIADMPSTTASSLRVFLQSPHGGMPNFQITRPQVDNVVTYILTLKGK